jgi:hypothetical protein
VFLLTAARKNHILLTNLDLLHRDADAMRACRTGRGHRVINTLYFERRRQTGRNRTSHCPGNHEWPDLANAFFPRGVGTADNVCRRRTTGSGNETASDIGHIGFVQAGIIYRLLHRDIGVGCSVTHEAANSAINVFADIDIDAAAHLAPEPHLLEPFIEADAGAALLQRIQNVFLAVAQTGYDPDAADYYASHRSALKIIRRGKQSNAQVFCRINLSAVHRDRAIGDGQRQPACHHALEVQAIGHQLRSRQHLTDELHLADPKRSTSSPVSRPDHEKPDQLPQRVQPETTGHYRIAHKVAVKKPEIGIYV